MGIRLMRHNDKEYILYKDLPCHIKDQLFGYLGEDARNRVSKL